MAVYGPVGWRSARSAWRSEILIIVRMVGVSSCAMSDEKLRELERRFRETGSAEDEVAWLRERARSSERLDWDSYSRLHDLDLKAAANYLQWRVETGDLTRERADVHAGGAVLLDSDPSGEEREACAKARALLAACAAARERGGGRP